eukprot:jgi/Ulvmu1/11761/UM008_0175.1
MMLYPSLRLAVLSSVAVCGATAVAHAPGFQARYRHCSPFQTQRLVGAACEAEEDCKRVPQQVLNCCDRCAFTAHPFKWFLQRVCSLVPGGPCERVSVLAEAWSPQAWVNMESDVADEPESLHQHLHSYHNMLPDVQCASADHCSLFPVDCAFVFSDPHINNFVANLFVAIHQATARSPHIPQVNLDRFDLFHAHLFLTKQHTLGLLFHAKEFPQESKSFPYNLGYCQRSSNLEEANMDWRNFLWHQGGLAGLDLSEDSELLDCLVPDWLRPIRTTYEGDFGTPLGDFYFFPEHLVGAQNASDPALPGLVLFFPRSAPT